MKTLIYTLVLTIALTAFFSCLGYYPKEDTRNIGSGTQYKGNSGLIIPGGGELLADTIIEPENATEQLDGDELTPTDSTTVSEMEMVQTEITTKEKNNMDGMLLSFWHGVAAVLIGETIALMVACAWMKIRRSDDGSSDISAGTSESTV